MKLIEGAEFESTVPKKNDDALIESHTRKSGLFWCMVFMIICLVGMVIASGGLNGLPKYIMNSVFAIMVLFGGIANWKIIKADEILYGKR